MIIGDPNKFALESEMSQAFERLSLMGLGFFVIHINGHLYGVRSSDATMLANSFDRVSQRLTDRGIHKSSLSLASSEDIAEALCRALYIDCPADEQFFGLSVEDFTNSIYEHHLLWAPDGDEAFDDGSHVLQFDVDQKVRLVAFTRVSAGTALEQTADLWLPAEDFYAILRSWKEAFQAEWESRPKSD